MRSILKNLFFFTLTMLVSVSCTKEPGVGGSATVTGKIYAEDYNTLGTPTGEYYAQNYKVYLIYGNEGGAFDDDVNTSHDGSFEFKYLQKGAYELFVYSDYSYCPPPCDNLGDSVISVKFQITDKKQELDLSDITILK
jgi:hypothetical protein